MYTFILATFNRKDKTKSILTELMNLKADFKISIILIDSDSKDGTREMALRILNLNKIDHKIIKLNSDVFWAKAMKFGLDYHLKNINDKEENNNFTVLLNDDISLNIKEVKNFLEFIKNNKEIGACVGSILDKSGQQIIYGGRRRTGILKHKFKMMEQVIIT